MAEDDKVAARTSYVVLKEISAEALTDTELAFEEGQRIFVTVEKPIEVSSADQACKRVAEAVGVGGVYASVPARSWDPAEYEVETTKVARRKIPGAA